MTEPTRPVKKQVTGGGGGGGGALGPSPNNVIHINLPPSPEMHVYVRNRPRLGLWRPALNVIIGLILAAMGRLWMAEVLWLLSFGYLLYVIYAVARIPKYREVIVHHGDRVD